MFAALKDIFESGFGLTRTAYYLAHAVSANQRCTGRALAAIAGHGVSLTLVDAASHGSAHQETSDDPDDSILVFV